MTLDAARQAAVRIVEKYHSQLPQEMQDLKLKILGDVGGSPWLFAILLGKLMALADPGEVETLRKLSLKKWLPIASDYLEGLKAQPVADGSYRPVLSKPTPSAAPSVPTYTKPTKPILERPVEPARVSVSGVAEGDKKPDDTPVKPPRVPPAPPAPPPGGSGPPDDPDMPPWLTEMEQEAYRQARNRAGEYARGLGNYVDQRTQTVIKEIWQGEVIQRFADKDKREENLELLRERTAEAIAHGWTADELARRMARETGDFGRNWERIAETELQGAYNDGVFIEAVKYEGKGARFARVPDAGACEACKSLFLNADGSPIIFTAEELDRNGTNVGRKRANWKATLWPIHPRCRCDIQPVPPGYSMDSGFQLVESKAKRGS